MKKILSSDTALWVVTVCAIAVALFSLYVSHRAETVIENFAKRCDELRSENATLREILSERGISITVVENAANTSKNATLAEKANNYLNIKALDGGEQWVGQIGVDRFGHCIFSSPAYSIRAGIIVLKNYEKKHGIKTVEALVKRFSSNNHADYIKHLCHELKLKKDEQFSITARMPELVRAMVKFETGKDLASDNISLLAVR